MLEVTQDSFTSGQCSAIVEFVNRDKTITIQMMSGLVCIANT